MNKDNALKLLRGSLNDSSAEFRHGQWEAIDSLVNGKKKLLVVQRTGWGKVLYISSVQEYLETKAGVPP